MPFLNVQESDGSNAMFVLAPFSVSLNPHSTYLFQQTTADIIIHAFYEKLSQGQNKPFRVPLTFATLKQCGTSTGTVTLQSIRCRSRFLSMLKGYGSAECKES